METNRKSYVDFSKNPYFNPSNGPKRKFQGYFHIIFFCRYLNNSYDMCDDLLQPYDEFYRSTPPSTWGGAPWPEFL